MNKRAGRIIPHSVVEYSRDNVNFFRTRLVYVQSFPATTGIDLQHMGASSILAFP